MERFNNDFTDREERIINAAVERAFLMMPEAITQLIMQKTLTKKLADEFFKANREFSSHLDLVQSVLEKTETENPGLPYDKILEMATPEIKDKLKTLTRLDFQPVSRPPTALIGDHGAL